MGVKAILVADAALIAGDLGDTPSPLTVTPGPPNIAAAPVPPLPLATISDFVPLANIKTFGMCNSPANPAVVAVTAAASGVFTPAPCVPAVMDPWAPAAPVTISADPAFDQQATCKCAWEGIITVVDPGQALAATVAGE